MKLKQYLLKYLINHQMDIRGFAKKALIPMGLLEQLLCNDVTSSEIVLAENIAIRLAMGMGITLEELIENTKNEDGSASIIIAEKEDVIFKYKDEERKTITLETKDENSKHVLEIVRAHNIYALYDNCVLVVSSKYQSFIVKAIKAMVDVLDDGTPTKLLFSLDYSTLKANEEINKKINIDILETLNNLERRGK